MALMSVIEPDAAQRAQMLALARTALCQAVTRGQADVPARASLAPYLQQRRACFVTLESGGQLRGCIGSLEPQRPLGQDLVHNAVAAALRDPRFPPLQSDEQVRISISVLTPLEPIEFSSEADLLGQLAPGQDGLLLQCGARQATFLPSVWQQLPGRQQFLAALKRKAGWTDAFWSPQMRAWRYRSLQFGEQQDCRPCEQPAD